MMNFGPRQTALQAAAFALGVLLAIPAGASVIKLAATLDCVQANAGAGTCATGGTGTGTALLMYDDVTNELTWNVEWSGLSAPTTVAHFHGPALPNQNAGVQVNFFALGGNLNPSMGSTFITPAQGNDLVNELWYVNIHSSSFPGGEIRGQLLQVPEPASALIFLAGLAGLAAVRRRRA